MEQVRTALEEWQVAIYLAAIVIGALAGFGVPKAGALEAAINPALAFMLFVTFLQVPLAELGSALRNTLPRCAARDQLRRHAGGHRAPGAAASR